jgi:primosomal protein N' (replication factor Y) (superfamily II helicase)
MYVITVVPLKRGIGIDTLTYFSTEDFAPGVLVHIPIRNTATLALVTKSEPVSSAKTALRAATFSLKKLPAQHITGSLSEAYIQTAKTLSTYYASPLGVILYNLLPPPIRTGDIPFPHSLPNTGTHQQPPEVFVAEAKERLLSYRSLVRETFAHSGSVLIVVPASIDAMVIEEALGQGITERVITLTSIMTKSELKKAYTALSDFSQTKLIIATPSHAVIERHDITTVIIERAHSSYYREMVRPYLDYRVVLKEHAHRTGRRLIYADLVVRTEEEYLRRSERYLTFGEVPKRIALTGKLEEIRMHTEESPQRRFTICSPAVATKIAETYKKKGKIFLFTARRGLAPVVGCMDCGYIFRSKESGAPYSLLRTIKNGTEERWFVCGTSGERIRASDTCTACGSWRLRERGIGIQTVHDEIRKLFPDVPIILFDHITAKTHKRALFLMESFYTAKGAILIGTHMALPYLTQPIDLSVIVTMDALLATPTWRIEEENFSLLMHLREVTNGPVLVQTRTETADTLGHARHGTIDQFYTEEISLRKEYKYPPDTTFIHLTWQGTPESVKETESIVATILKDFSISFYQNPTAPSEAPIMYGLMRLPAHSWPHENLSHLLRSLPPTVRIMINPDRIV